MNEIKYLQYNASLVPLDGKIVLCGGRFGKKILANDIIVEIMRLTSIAICERDLIDYICTKFSISKKIAKEILILLQQKGFLAKDYIVISHRTAHSFRTSSISSFGLITCDRPDALKSAISSYIANAHNYNHEVDFFVVDDSNYSHRKNLNILQELSGKYECCIHYMGTRERKKLVDLLEHQLNTLGELLLFGLFPKSHLKESATVFSAGAARNCAMAFSPERKLLVADDDSLPIGNYSSKLRTLSFSRGTASKRNLYFNKQPSTYMNHDIDVITLNNAYLGKSLQEILADQKTIELTTFFNKCPIFLGNQNKYFDSVVGFTVNSIQGVEDISVGTFLLGDNYKEKWFVEETNSDCICAQPLLLTTTVTGIDPKVFTVPFIPTFRNEDIMTGMIYNKIDPLAIAAHINSNLLHNKEGGYSAIRNSKSNFYEEIVFPDIFHSILNATNMLIPNTVLPLQKKTQILKNCVDAICGKNCNEMIHNLCAIDNALLDRLSQKIHYSLEKTCKLFDLPYTQTIPRTIDELVTNDRIDMLRKSLLQYMDLLVFWPEIIDVCGTLKNKSLFPTCSFNKGKKQEF